MQWLTLKAIASTAYMVLPPFLIVDFFDLEGKIIAKRDRFLFRNKTID